MKKLLLALIAVGLLGGLVSAAEKKAPVTKKDRISYAIGADIGQRLKSQSLELNTAMVARGLMESVGGGKLALSKEEMAKALAEFRNEMRAKMETRRTETGSANAAAAKAFLDKNKGAKGVTTTKSGLQYQVVRKGTGKAPAPESTVTVHYRGTLLDGTEFDSSYSRNSPASFPVKGVIKGWTEALLLMKTGAKWKLFIPSDLAYGPRGAGGRIGPDAALVFEVELLEVK